MTKISNSEKYSCWVPRVPRKKVWSEKCSLNSNFDQSIARGDNYRILLLVFILMPTDRAQHRIDPS
jgi:hypothetical protein